MHLKSKGHQPAKTRKINAETKESPYDPDFVAMIKTAEKRGNYKEINGNDVWGGLGITQSNM